MYGYTYYIEGQTGWDPNMPRRCPHCGGRCYSSTTLENMLSGSTAQCPHCHREF